MAGLLCSAGKVDVSISTLVLSLIGAGILGNFTGYWFGYRTGPVLFSKNDSLFFKQRYVVLASEFYNKYGGMALILGRFFPIVRTFAPIFAGVVKVDFKRFSLYNLIGSVTWVCVFTLGGFFLGKKFPQLKDYLQYIVLGLILITTIPLIIAYFRKKYVEAKESKN